MQFIGFATLKSPNQMHGYLLHLPTVATGFYGHSRPRATSRYARQCGIILGCNKE